MTCLRCQGLMVSIRLEDAGSSASYEAFSGWQCLLCGEVLEPGMAANRKAHQEPRRILARPPGTWVAGADGLKRIKPRK